MDFYAFPFFSENDAPCREMFILNLKRVSVLTVSTHFKAQPFYLESGALKMEKSWWHLHHLNVVLVAQEDNPHMPMYLPWAYSTSQTKIDYYF